MNTSPTSLIKILLRAIIIGCLATITMDLWALIIYCINGHRVSYALIGKIVSYLFQGNLAMNNIPHDASMPIHHAIGWATHYSIGCCYALIYEITVLHGLQERSNGFKTILFAWTLMVFPFCVLAPVFGKGLFYLKAQHPLHDSLFTFSSHTAFGVGLWMASLCSEGIKKMHVVLQWTIYSFITILFAVLMSITGYQIMR